MTTARQTKNTEVQQAFIEWLAEHSLKQKGILEIIPKYDEATLKLIEDFGAEIKKLSDDIKSGKIKSKKIKVIGRKETKGLL